MPSQIRQLRQRRHQHIVAFARHHRADREQFDTRPRTQRRVATRDATDAGFDNGDALGRYAEGVVRGVRSSEAEMVGNGFSAG